MAVSIGRGNTGSVSTQQARQGGRILQVAEPVGGSDSSIAIAIVALGEKGSAKASMCLPEDVQEHGQDLRIAISALPASAGTAVLSMTTN